MRRVACGAALLAAACAGGFTRPAPEALRIGETTQSEAIARLGPPTARDTIERRGQKVAIVAYRYTTEAERQHGEPGVIASRNLYLFFHDDRLVGHEYRSSIESDHTDFDPRKARAVVKGQSTREEVEKLLGRPSGYLTFPMVDASLGGAMVYAYTQQRRVPFGSPIVYNKNLLITFDPTGTVNGAFYEATGTP